MGPPLPTGVQPNKPEGGSSCAAANWGWGCAPQALCCNFNLINMKIIQNPIPVVWM